MKLFVVPAFYVVGAENAYDAFTKAYCNRGNAHKIGPELNLFVGQVIPVTEMKITRDAMVYSLNDFYGIGPR